MMRSAPFPDPYPASPVAQDSSGASSWRRGVHGYSIALAALLVIGLLLRLHGIDFGLPALNDPDELMFELGSVKMLREATLNPGWFGHPATTTMYALAIVNASVFATSYIAGWFPSVRAFADAIYSDPGLVILPGRVLMTLFALGTIALTCRLGTRLGDRRVGLAAAALLTVSPLHIGYSQIIRSDMMATFFMLLSMLAALTFAREGTRRSFVMAGFWLAVAIATKWPFALGGGAMLGAIGLRAWRMPEERGRLARNLVLFGTMTVAFLLLVSPYLLLDLATVTRNLRGEAQIRHLGATGYGLLGNIWWYVSGPIWSSLGILGTALVMLGGVIFRRRAEVGVIIVPVLLGLLLLFCMQTLVWERWILPILPLLAVVAGFGLAAFHERVSMSLSGRALPLLLVMLVSGGTLVPLALSVQANARARLNDTRQQASAWALRNIASGSSVLIEHFAFDLVRQPWRFVFPMGETGCVDAKAYIQGKYPYATIERSRGGRSNVDYGTMPPARAGSCRTNYAILTQYDRYRAERDVFPAEYANYECLLARGQIVATFMPKAGEVGGPVVRIVRFRN
jgi:hypothetical protein